MELWPWPMYKHYYDYGGYYAIAVMLIYYLSYLKISGLLVRGKNSLGYPITYVMSFWRVDNTPKRYFTAPIRQTGIYRIGALIYRSGVLWCRRKANVPTHQHARTIFRSPIRQIYRIGAVTLRFGALICRVGAAKDRIGVLSCRRPTNTPTREHNITIL